MQEGGRGSGCLLCPFGFLPPELCPFPSPTGQQQLTVQNVSGNNLTISGLSPTQIQLQMEQALAGEAQPGEKRRRMACTCPNCKDGDKR